MSYFNNRHTRDEGGFTEEDYKTMATKSNPNHEFIPDDLIRRRDALSLLESTADPETFERQFRGLQEVKRECGHDWKLLFRHHSESGDMGSEFTAWECFNCGETRTKSWDS